MDFYNEQLKCAVNRMAYDWRSAIGRIWLAPDHCCDMNGCIRMFTALDPKVISIFTFQGEADDTVYMKVHGEWRAFDPDREQK